MPGFDLDRDRLTDRLRRLVAIPSENPPGDEAAVAAEVAGMAEELGLEVSTHEAEAGRPSVVARYGTGGSPHLVFCSHLDVVPAGDRGLWEWDPYGAEVAHGYLHGRGSGDAKASVAAALEAAGMLTASGLEPAGTLHLALVADEEAMGFKGAHHLVEERIVPPEAAIVGEPTSLRVVRAQRGACWFRLTVHGRASHGSAPERGRSAILHMAEVVARLPETLPGTEHEVLGGPSLNVGTIRGGEKVNIVPASCVIEIDRRTLPGETEREVTGGILAAVDRARERYPDLEADVELQFSAAPYEVDPRAGVVEATAAAIERTTGAPAELAGFRGASDARFFAAAGAEVVVCGPGDIALAHTASERVELAEVERAAEVYARAFAELVGS